MVTKEIKYNSAEYAKELELRTEILRKPLGKKLADMDTYGEEYQLHFGIFSEDQLIACIVVKPIVEGVRVKMRQMAVAVSAQGQGVGKKLMQDTEALLKQRGYKQIEMSARKTAIGFYEKLGYKPVGGMYLELGIEHIAMQKTI